MLKTSFFLPIFLKKDEMTVDQLLEQAKKIGYDAVDVGNPGRYADHATILEAVKRSGLTAALMAGQNSLTDGFANAANHDKIRDDLKKNLEIAVRYGVKSLLSFTGNRVPGKSEYDQLMTSVDFLRSVSGEFEAAGVTLGIEYLNSRVNHPGYFFDSTDCGIAICRFTGSERVKILFDIYHVQIMEGDLVRNLRKAFGCIGHIHVAGNPGRHEPLEGQEINYAAIRDELASLKYQGFVGMEYGPTVAPIESLRRSLAFFRQ